MPEPDHTVWMHRSVELTEQEADLSEECYKAVVEDLIQRTREEFLEAYVGRHG